MGKVPGIRNRTKRARTPSEHARSCSPAATDISTRESSREPIPDPSYFPLYDDTFLAWAPEKPEESYDLGLNETGYLAFGSDSFHMSSQPSPNFPPVSDLDFQPPYPNFAIDGMQTPPISNDYDYMPSTSYPTSLAGLHRQQLGLLNPPTPKSTCSSSTPPSRTSSPIPDFPGTTTRGCISACNEIIEYLDSHIHLDLTALDAVMRVNQTAATKLARLLSLPECRASASCPLLICIAMEQIVTLFECSIRTSSSSSSSSLLPTSDNTNNVVLPNLGFGFFQVDAEEMVALRAHIITKELRRAFVVLETLIRALTSPNLQRVPSIALHRQWTGDMATRLRGLVMVVDGWKRGCGKGFVGV